MLIIICFLPCWDPAGCHLDGLLAQDESFLTWKKQNISGAWIFYLQSKISLLLSTIQKSLFSNQVAGIRGHTRGKFERSGFQKPLHISLFHATVTLSSMTVLDSEGRDGKGQ